MPGYTLDTNAIIYFLKADAKAGPFVRELIIGKKTLYISTITEVELFGFPDLTTEEKRDITKLANSFSAIPLDSYLARLAGDLRRFYNMKTPDSVIAATALFTGSILVTRNTHDFKRVEGLVLREI